MAILSNKKVQFTFNPELCRNETEVESKLIVQELLPALGYTPDVWHQEIAFGNIRLDFVAFAQHVFPLNRSQFPLSLVVETKGPKENLDRHEHKLKHYLLTLHAHFGVLTNGKEFRIYRRVEGSVKQVFNCRGYEICERLPDIKKIIGREEIRQAITPPVPVIKVEQKPVINAELEQVIAPVIPVVKVESQPTDNLELNRGVRKMKVIAVYHNKGGVGKTTISVNLSAALSRKGLKVLLIDIDSQANSTFATGLIKFQLEKDDDIKDSNITHLLQSGDHDFIPDLVRKSVFFNDPEIDVIPSHITLIDIQEKLNKTQVVQTRLPAKLKKVENNYDIAIIDTPPSRDLYAQLPMMAADYLIIPSDLRPFANQGLPNVKNFVEEVNESRRFFNKNELKILGVLPSKISTNAQFLKNTFPTQKGMVIKKYNLPVFETVIFERVALSHCASGTSKDGDLEIPNPQSIFKFDAQSPSAQEFENLASELLTKI